LEAPEDWHAVIGDPTYAEAILDRLVYNARRLDLSGDSLQRTRSKPAERPPDHITSDRLLAGAARGCDSAVLRSPGRKFSCLLGGFYPDDIDLLISSG
jgi:hypothetical protein